MTGRTIISNLYTNTGHGSKGWTLSFGSCQLLADIIDQKATKVNYLYVFKGNLLGVLTRKPLEEMEFQFVYLKDRLCILIYNINFGNVYLLVMYIDTR